MKPTAGIYAHIPFCMRKCEYCDFYSIVVNNPDQFNRVVDSYLSAIYREARYYRSWAAEYEFNSLFLGGGTPTLVPAPRLAELVTFLKREYQLPPDAEITIEANPKTVSPESLEVLRDSGVGRISLGAQAFQDSILQRLGRTHSVTDVKESVAALKEAGFTNYNLDLMFGLPGQTMAMWKESLDVAISLEPTHLSCYSLIIEENTPFHHLYTNGILDLPGEDMEREMLEYAAAFLDRQGYRHYEVSNFCLPGYESQHNLHYWKNRPYVGLGCSASGRVGNTRYTNVANINDYIATWQKDQPSLALNETIDMDLAMDETLICGLRLIEGVSDTEFSARFGHSLGDIYHEQIKGLEARGLVTYQAGQLKLTREGLFLGNLVFAEFLRY